MKAKVKYCFIIYIVMLLVVCSKQMHAQAPPSDAKRVEVPDKDKPWTPSDSPEGKAEKKAKKSKKKHKKTDSNLPLTDKELGQKLKQDEKDQKKDYQEYHSKIQSKKVRKRMEENAKRSQDYNTGKRPSFWQRMKIKFSKQKKKRVKKRK